MYCPKCKEEFNEGIIHCNTCDVFLVHDLPKKKVDFSKLLGFDVEKILKCGGLILIVLQVISAILNTYNCFLTGQREKIYFVLAELCKGVLSGLLFYGVGQMIGLIKRGTHHEA